MKDYIVTGMAANNQVRAFAITSKELVEIARQHHNTSPVATAALGRLLSAGAMMGSMMKNEKDVLTLQIKAGGPLEGMTVISDSKATVKGYVGNPAVMLPAKNGKLDVGEAVGIGFMNVIKDMGLKEPYMGQAVLQTGEIAEDLTFYYATSEQIPSSVGLGVLMERDNTVKQAGGFIIQLLPFASEETIVQLEENLKNLDTVTNMLEKGLSPEEILGEVLKGLGVEFTDKFETKFECDCSRQKVRTAVMTVGKEELEAMIADGEEIEARCDFCSTGYIFNVDELKEILAEGM
ncbi:MAG: Hsp33 family molecular chaperone HslO [Eubacteriales bacterium]